MTKLEYSLSVYDKFVLKFVTKKKMTSNWIQSNIFLAFLHNKSRFSISKQKTDYILRKLAKRGLIKTEKWEMVHKRVYWK